MNACVSSCALKFLSTNRKPFCFRLRRLKMSCARANAFHVACFRYACTCSRYVTLFCSVHVLLWLFYSIIILRVYALTSNWPDPSSAFPCRFSPSHFIRLYRSPSALSPIVSHHASRPSLHSEDCRLAGDARSRSCKKEREEVSLARIYPVFLLTIFFRPKAQKKTPSVVDDEADAEQVQDTINAEQGPAAIIVEQGPAAINAELELVEAPAECVKLRSYFEFSLTNLVCRTPSPPTAKQLRKAAKVNLPPKDDDEYVSRLVSFYSISNFAS